LFSATRLRLAIAGGRQRGDRAAVPGAVHHDDGRHLDAALVAIQARELDRRLVGLGPRAVEERVVHPRELGESRAEALLLGHLVEVGDVHHLRRLVGDGGDQPRVCVAEAVDGDAGERVEVAASGRIPQPRAFAAYERDWQSLVGVHQVAGHRRVLRFDRRAVPRVRRRPK
jgi:hypothetical protein